MRDAEVLGETDNAFLTEFQNLQHFCQSEFWAEFRQLTNVV
jgi:hypothetical protein